MALRGVELVARDSCGIFSIGAEGLGLKLRCAELKLSWGLRLLPMLNLVQGCGVTCQYLLVTSKHAACRREQRPKTQTAALDACDGASMRTCGLDLFLFYLAAWLGDSEQD